MMTLIFETDLFVRKYNSVPDDILTHFFALCKDKAKKDKHKILEISDDPTALVIIIDSKKVFRNPNKKWKDEGGEAITGFWEKIEFVDTIFAKVGLLKIYPLVDCAPLHFIEKSNCFENVERLKKLAGIKSYQAELENYVKSNPSCFSEMTLIEKYSRLLSDVIWNDMTSSQHTAEKDLVAVSDVRQLASNSNSGSSITSCGATFGESVPPLQEASDDTAVSSPLQTQVATPETNPKPARQGKKGMSPTTLKKYKMLYEMACTHPEMCWRKIGGDVGNSLGVKISKSLAQMGAKRYWDENQHLPEIPPRLK